MDPQLVKTRLVFVSRTLLLGLRTRVSPQKIPTEMRGLKGAQISRYVGEVTSYRRSVNQRSGLSFLSYKVGHKTVAYILVL